jgi:hypothetical protein
MERDDICVWLQVIQKERKENGKEKESYRQSETRE